MGNTVHQAYTYKTLVPNDFYLYCLPAQSIFYCVLIHKVPVIFDELQLNSDKGLCSDKQMHYVLTHCLIDVALR